MPIIPRRFHATLDYLWSGAIAKAPNLCGFAENEAATNYCRAQAAVATSASLFTDYELGLAKAIPFSAHLKLDLAGAFVGLAAPWLLGFADNKRARNTVLAFAIVELAVVALSRHD